MAIGLNLVVSDNYNICPTNAITNDMDETSVIVFDDDDVAYLYRSGKIVASSRDLDEIEKLANDTNFGHPYLTPDFAPQGQLQQGGVPCPNCGSPQCNGQCQADQAAQQPVQANPLMPTAGKKDHEEEREEEIEARLETDDDEKCYKKATHIVTPNGVRGKIVGRAKGIFADEVTVRLANGRIAKYELVPGHDYGFENENAPNLSPYENLRSILDKVPIVSRASLLERIDELKGLQREARALAASAPYLDAQTLDDLIITAAHEMKEAADVIQGLDQQSYQEQPSDWQAVEQASFGKGDASWLADTLADALGEAQATDYDRLMGEGPESLISEVETPVLNDQEAVNTLANDFVTSKTVGLDPQAVKEFRQAFLSRVDEVRIKEASNRQEEAQRQAAQKVAKRNEVSDTPTPDESLFL